MGVVSNVFRSAAGDPKFPIKGNIDVSFTVVFVSLNFDYPFPNAERLQKEERLNLLEYYFTKWGLIVILGFAIGIIFMAVTVLIEELTLLKTKVFMGHIFAQATGTGLLIYLAFTVGCSVVSALPVLYFHPVVQGVGVPETRSFLNGVDVPGMEEVTSIPTRIFSTILMVLASQPGGQTESLLPIGPTLASFLSRLKVMNRRLFPNHRYDGNRRDLGAVGLGAAASSNFGSPVGGLFFALQQLSTWSEGMTFMIIVGSLVASYTFIATYNAIRNADRVYTNANSLFTPFNTNTDFGLYEFPAFILMAVIGGCVGAVWIAVHEQLARLRVRLITKKYMALVEVAVVSIVIALPFLALYHFADHCSTKTETTKFGGYMQNALEGNTCPDGKFDTTALFLLSNPETTVRTVLGLADGEMGLIFTLLVFLCTFFCSALHLGTFTTNGCVVPNLAMGALWGRLFKTLVVDKLYSSEPLQITKYAYLGAVAQVSGVTQYSLAFGVMMVETVGVVNFSLPVFLVIFLARYVSQLFVAGIYDVTCYTKGYAVLDHSPPPLFTGLRAKDVMSARLVCLPMTMSAGAIRNMLAAYNHLEFPVLSIGDVLDAASGEPVGACKGLILRKQLLPLLTNDRKESITLRLSLSKTGYGDAAPETIVDISKYMNQRPFFVLQEMPLTRLYSFFETLNLHTVLVVNETNQVKLIE